MLFASSHKRISRIRVWILRESNGMMTVAMRYLPVKAGARATSRRAASSLSRQRLDKAVADDDGNHTLSLALWRIARQHDTARSKKPRRSGGSRFKLTHYRQAAQFAKSAHERDEAPRRKRRRHVELRAPDKGAASLYSGGVQGNERSKRAGRAATLQRDASYPLPANRCRAASHPADGASTRCF